MCRLQASRDWYDNVKGVSLAEKYIQSKHESCIFSRQVDKKIIVIAVFVEDFFFYNCDDLAKKLTTSLKSRFTIKG